MTVWMMVYIILLMAFDDVLDDVGWHWMAYDDGLTCWMRFWMTLVDDFG